MAVTKKEAFYALSGFVILIIIYNAFFVSKEGYDDVNDMPVGDGTVSSIVPQSQYALTDRVHNNAIKGGHLTSVADLREKRAGIRDRLNKITPLELLPPVMRGDDMANKDYENRYRWVKNFTSGTEKILQGKNFVDFSSPRFMGAVNPPKKNMNQDIRKPPAVRINKKLPLWIGMPGIPNQAADLMRKKLD